MRRICEEGGGTEVPEELVLAALRRAVLHSRGAGESAPLSALLAHLAADPRSRRARAVRASLERLSAKGLIERGRAHGRDLWRLAPAGARALARAEASGHRPALPESPQHRAWRSARLHAARELGGFADAFREDLAEAAGLLAALESGDLGAPCSRAWLALGPRLLSDCRRLGSAWHCLHEWREPSELAPDLDPDAADPLCAGRRNIALWRPRA